MQKKKESGEIMTHCVLLKIFIKKSEKEKARQVIGLNHDDKRIQSKFRQIAQNHPDPDIKN